MSFTNNNNRVRQELQRLDAIISSFNYDLDPLYQSVLAQYICVRLSGVIENTVRDTMTRTAEGLHPRASRFISKTLNSFQNPKTGKIFDLIGQFDDDWRKELEISISDECKAAINSVVANRHAIAHGGSSQISLHQIKTWMVEIKKFCAFLDSICTAQK